MKYKHSVSFIYSTNNIPREPNMSLILSPYLQLYYYHCDLRFKSCCVCLFFQENSLTLGMIEYLSNCQEMLNTSKVITCCGYSDRVWIGNVKIIFFRAHWSPTLHLSAFFALVTSSYILCPEHEASFLPSLQAAFLSPTPSQFPIILLSHQDAA